jgi:hypothetical protein
MDGSDRVRMELDNTWLLPPFTQIRIHIRMFSNTNTKQMSQIRIRIRIFTRLEDNIYQISLLIIYNYKIMYRLSIST